MIRMQKELQLMIESEVKGYVATIEDVVLGAAWFFSDYCDDYTTSEDLSTEYARIAKYFEDTQTVELVSGLRGDYRGAIIYLTIGSPVITYDTRTRLISGRFDDAQFECYVKSFANDAVNDYFSEQFQCLRGVC